MPGYPQPVGRHGNIPTWWNAILQALQRNAQQAAALNAGSTQGNLVDRWGNTVEVAGTNLDQVVTIGAAFQQAGVLVGTALSGAGRAKQQNLATGTITVTEGSTSATLDSTASGAFASGMVIGAADVTDPTSGLATPAIVPGTTFTIAGTAVTLSQAAAETGVALYCAACNWVNL